MDGKRRFWKQSNPSNLSSHRPAVFIPPNTKSNIFAAVPSFSASAIGCYRLAPKVVTVVEQDLSHAGSFLGRFVEAIHYYSVLFDSLGSSYGEESEERDVVEQQLLSKEDASANKQIQC